jgi:hypothetical protein
MFNPSRDQARRFFFDTWAKYRQGAPISDLEQVALKVIGLHPEYHGLLEDIERNVDRDYPPDDGSINPFLHLSLHLAVEEQLSLDQPSGVRAQYDRIAAITGSEHDARHALLECLGETIWQAQRTGAAPDSTAYLACLAAKSGAGDC